MTRITPCTDVVVGGGELHRWEKTSAYTLADRRGRVYYNILIYIYYMCRLHKGCRRPEV